MQKGVVEGQNAIYMELYNRVRKEKNEEALSGLPDDNYVSCSLRAATHTNDDRLQINMRSLVRELVIAREQKILSRALDASRCRDLQLADKTGMTTEEREHFTALVREIRNHQLAMLKGDA